jgi:hypothetical protein
VRASPLTALIEAAWYLDFGEFGIRSAAGDHAFDTVVSAVVARAAAFALTTPPRSPQHELARSEGWIHLPELPFSELAPKRAGLVLGVDGGPPCRGRRKCDAGGKTECGAMRWWNAGTARGRASRTAHARCGDSARGTAAPRRAGYRARGSCWTTTDCHVGIVFLPGSTGRQGPPLRRGAGDHGECWHVADGLTPVGAHGGQVASRLVKLGTGDVVVGAFTRG